MIFKYVRNTYTVFITVYDFFSAFIRLEWAWLHSISNFVMEITQLFIPAPSGPTISGIFNLQLQFSSVNIS